MAAPTSFIVDPVTGNVDPVRLANAQSILYSALGEADRITGIALSKAQADSSPAGTTIVNDLQQNTIPRLANYRAGVDTASSDANSGLWGTAITKNNMTAFQNTLAAIQQEILFSNQDIAALVAADQQPGFWTALYDRAAAIVQAAYDDAAAVAQGIYDAAAAAAKAAQKTFGWYTFLAGNFVPLALGGIFLYFFLPSILKTVSAGRKGGANAALDTAAGELESGRRTASSAAGRVARAGATAAKVALLGAPKVAPYQRKRARRKTRNG